MVIATLSLGEDVRYRWKLVSISLAHELSAKQLEGKPGFYFWQGSGQYGCTVELNKNVVSRDPREQGHSRDLDARECLCTDTRITARQPDIVC